VVDGVAAAVGLIEVLARLGLKTSKRGGYATPLAKPFHGKFAGDGLIGEKLWRERMLQDR
jgi:allantoin racemase